MSGLSGFILQLYDTENEEQIWQTWLHKDVAMEYEEFKKKYFKQIHKPKVKSLTKEEEDSIIKNAMRFIKPRDKGGEK